MTVQRKRRGAIVPGSAFPSQPLRLYNFLNGALTDEGSAGVAIGAVGAGVFTSVTGFDGLGRHAYHFAGVHAGLGSSDAGLPSGLAPRSYGCWIKGGQATGTVSLMGWGAGTSSGSGAWLGLFNGNAGAQSASDPMTGGSFVADGLPHFIVAVEENAPADGVKRKVYVDGRLVGSSLVLGSITLGGANRFRIGLSPDGNFAFNGEMGFVFVTPYALTGDQIRALYNISSQQLLPSPKAAEEHIEAFEAARLLGVFDGVETADAISLAVMA